MSDRRPAFGDFWRGRRVLVTGHTGFKGSWLTLWLQQLGADVAGFALAPPTTPSHWELLRLTIPEARADLADADALQTTVKAFQPEIVFHLAAQPLVRASYKQPAQTFATNVVGTLNVYEACRKAQSVRAIVSITTDKVYENREWEWGYRECDPLGGQDPYSASKACAEIATSSYRDSFWPLAAYKNTHETLIATARAGNVVGGGDWATDRLIPDLMRAAALSSGMAVIRNPDSTRPWQHVLEPLCGYLILGQHLLEGNTAFAESWNFGPDDDGVQTVRDVVRRMHDVWGAIRAEFRPDPTAPHEARLLKLDCSKARARLGWKPVWGSQATAQLTADWYRYWYERGRVISAEDIQRYVRDARTAGVDGI